MQESRQPLVLLCIDAKAKTAALWRGRKKVAVLAGD